MLYFLLALLPFLPDPPQQAPAAGALSAYEARRRPLATQFDTGAMSAAQPGVVALAADLQDDEAVPAWYRAEVHALAKDCALVAALSEAERTQLEQALAAQPDPRSDPDGALATLEEAAATIGATLGPGHPSVSQRYFYLSNIAAQLGRWDASIPYAERALETAESLPKERSAQVALRRMWLGWLLRTVARYEESEAHLLQAHTTMQRLRARELGAFREQSVHVVNYLGTLYTDLHRLEEAEPLLREYAQASSEVFGPGSVQYLAGLNNLGRLYDSRNDLDAAVAIYAECVAQATLVIDPSNPMLAHAWYNLGTACGRAGRVQDSREALEQCLRLAEPLNVGREVIPLALSSLARMSILVDDSEGATQYAEAALVAGAAQGEMAVTHRGSLLEGLLWSHVVQENWSRVAELLTEYRELGGELWPGRLALYEGALAEEEGQLDSALKRYLFAQEQWQDSTSTGSGWSIVTLTRIAGVQARKGELEQARDSLLAASEHYDHSRSKITEGFGRSLFHHSPYPRLALLEFQRGDWAAGWRTLETHRARALEELLNRVASERQDQLQREQTALESQLHALGVESLATSTNPVERRAAALESRLLELRAMRLRSAPLPNLPAPDVRTVQASLRSDEAILGWFEIDWLGLRSTYGYALRSSGEPHVVRLAHGPEETTPSLVERAQAYALALADEAQSAFGPDPALALEEADALGKALFAPLLGGPEWSGIQHLVLTTGDFEGVPMDALRVDGRWIGDRWTLSYAPSSRLHADLQAGPSPGRSERPALVLGDPPFRSEHLDKESTRIAARTPALRKGRILSDLERMPESRLEAEAVAAVFPGSTLWTGRAANEAGLQRLAREDRLKGFAVVHLASHALVDADNPRDSGLALSQVGLADPYKAALEGLTTSDGFLSTAEILGWRLDADLVTLSACRSALGSRVRGEGYIGLSTAFLRAGARSILASLWDVQDEPTRLFMGAFYTHWQAHPGQRAKAGALQAAREALRTFEREGQRPYAHPAYWAAFVLMGNPD